MNKVNQFLSLTMAALSLSACNGGGSSSSSPSEAQQFAKKINSEITLLSSGGSIPYQVTFPVTQGALSTQAYLITATPKVVSFNPLPLSLNMYISPTLYTFSDNKWQSTVLPFASESTFISSLSVINGSIYMAAESYVINNSPNNAQLSLNYDNLYQYNNGTLSAVTNPFNSSCNTGCNITNMVVSGSYLYVAGWNDNGTQIYSYDGTTWTNLLSNHPVN